MELNNINKTALPRLAAFVAAFLTLLLSGCAFNSGNFANGVKPPPYPVGKLATATTPATTSAATTTLKREFLQAADGSLILVDGKPILVSETFDESQAKVFQNVQIARLWTAAMAKRGITGYFDANGVFHYATSVPTTTTSTQGGNDGSVQAWRNASTGTGAIGGYVRTYSTQ